MQEKTVILYGRYGYKHKLIRIARGVYEYKPDPESGECMRLGGKNYKDLDFIDPSGGPFIAKNSFIPELRMYVKNISIENDKYLIKVTKNDISSVRTTKTI